VFIAGSAMKEEINKFFIQMSSHIMTRTEFPFGFTAHVLKQLSAETRMSSVRINRKEGEF
jgi:hypothetical protein